MDLKLKDKVVLLTGGTGGIGTAIIKVMEEYVKEINKDSITVNASPFGIPFYHSIGFEDTGKQTVNGGMTITPMRKLL